MMQRTRDDACPSDLTFDAALANELDNAAVQQLQAHVAECDACRARQAQLQAARTEFLTEAPSFDAHRKLVVEALPKSNLSVLQPVMMSRAFGALALCALALLALRPWEPTFSVRTKGSAHLGVFIKHDQRVRRGASGDQVQANDLLRFTYSSERDAYFALLNLDANGARVYFPSQDTPPKRMSAGFDVALDFSVQLDDQPGTERVIGVFCDEPFEISELLAELEATKQAPLMRGCHFDELRFRKQPMP